MTSGILITGAPAALTGAIAAECARRDRGPLLTVAPGSGDAPTLPDAVKTIPFQPRSVLATRALLSSVGAPPTTVVVAAAPEGLGDLLDVTPATIQTTVDEHVTGLLALLREVLATYRAGGGGRLVAAWVDDEHERASLVAAVVEAAFRAAVQSLLVRSQRDTVAIFGLEVRLDDAAQAGQAASWIYDAALDPASEPTGRWQRMGGTRTINPFRKGASR